ncbi:MAG: hypothetical protein AAF184_20635 [Pseudomonadota bacterium]
MIDQLIFILTAGCIFGLIRGFYWLSKRDAASVWPEVIGEVREEAPGTTFESLQSGLLNNDSDHYVYWTIEGKEYRKRLWDEASVAIGMFKVWRRTPELGPMTIRCNPDDPSQAFTAQEARIWKEPVIWAVGAGVVAGILALIT